MNLFTILQQLYLTRPTLNKNKLYNPTERVLKKLFHLGLANLNFHWLVASTSLEIKLDFFPSRISRIALKSFKIPIKIQILTVFGWNRKKPAMKTLRCKIQFFGPKKNSPKIFVEKLFETSSKNNSAKIFRGKKHREDFFYSKTRFLIISFLLGNIVTKV